MPTKLRISLQIAAALVLIFFAIQPYNWFCQLTQKCKPLTISYYLPKKEGTKEVKVYLETMNYKRDIKFTVDKPEIKTFANRKNEITYTITNNSKKLVRIKPKMTIEPEDVSKYIKTYQCICFQSYKLKPKESITLKMEFELGKEIETETFTSRVLENGLKIRFKI